MTEMFLASAYFCRKDGGVVGGKFFSSKEGFEVILRELLELLLRVNDKSTVSLIKNPMHHDRVSIWIQGFT